MLISPVQPTQNSNNKTARRVLTAAAAAGTILYLAKKGKLDAVEGGNKYIEKIKAFLKKPADFINGKISDAIKSLQKNETIGKKMESAQQYVSEKVAEVKANPDVKAAVNTVKVKKSQVVSAVRNTIDSVKNLAEKEINPEKFGEKVKDIVS